MENLVPPVDGRATATPQATSLPLPATLYFCIPQNDKLLGYWDTVADRLFKIRHCMNIEGVVRQLAAVRAADRPGRCSSRRRPPASTSAASLADVNAPVPLYRFSSRCRRRTSSCNEVKALGAALLAALEKQDAEALALLRSTHEIAVLKAAREVRQAAGRRGERRARGDFEKSKDAHPDRAMTTTRRLRVHERGRADAARK